jgi:hypothetical protein
VPDRGDDDVTPTRRRWQLAAGAVVLVVALVAVWEAGSSESARLDRAEAREAALRQELQETRAGIARERLATVAARERGTTLTRQRAAARLDVATTRVEYEAAQVPLSVARITSAFQTNRLAAVRQCLDGVRRALDRTRVRDTAGATALLRATAAACQAALARPGEPTPVLPYDFADPFVLRANGQYYAYATNAGGGAVQSAHSRDLTSWDFTGNVLAGLPPWASPGAVWAPAAIVRGPTTVLYYTTREAFTGRQCLSVAVSGSPAGPFLDGSTGPLECSVHGAIDASPFLDLNGSAWLLYKTERPARIVSRPLTPDGRAFAGPPRDILAPTQRWEGGNVEAPSMVRTASGYWLFYSGNDWNGRNYAEGVARCTGPQGPCHADGRNPLLASIGVMAGPGGGEGFHDGNSWRLAYHAYREPLVRYPNSRLLHFARIDFDGQGRPVVVPG